LFGQHKTGSVFFTHYLWLTAALTCATFDYLDCGVHVRLGYDSRLYGGRVTLPGTGDGLRYGDGLCTVTRPHRF